jgi:hypothetical protein
MDFLERLHQKKSQGKASFIWPVDTHAQEGQKRIEEKH